MQNINQTMASLQDGITRQGIIKGDQSGSFAPHINASYSACKARYEIKYGLGLSHGGTPGAHFTNKCRLYITRMDR